MSEAEGSPDRVRCPHCGEGGGEKSGIGDLAVCGACGKSFWLLEGEGEGRPVAPPEKAPLSKVSVVGLHLGVLAAEGILALTVMAIFVGLPLFGLGRLFGIF
ncbi:MAG: hypothetical protein ACYTHM_02515 [Planctomycetota bacterium]|jgi:hypothetical protein